MVWSAVKCKILYACFEVISGTGSISTIFQVIMYERNDRFNGNKFMEIKNFAICHSIVHFNHFSPKCQWLCAWVLCGCMMEMGWIGDVAIHHLGWEALILSFEYENGQFVQKLYWWWKNANMNVYATMWIFVCMSKVRLNIEQCCDWSEGIFVWEFSDWGCSLWNYHNWPPRQNLNKIF